MTTVKTILTPGERKIRSIQDQNGSYYYCFTDVCKALHIDPVKAINHLRCSYIVSFPVKVHFQHDTTRFLMLEGFERLSEIFKKPEAIGLRDYLQNSEKATETTEVASVVQQCKPIVSLMFGLRKYRDSVASVFHDINKDDDMELHKDYIQVQEYIAKAIDSLGKIAGSSISQAINY